MRALLLFGCIMLIALGVGEVCASGDIYKSSDGAFCVDDSHVNHDIDFLKHYNPNYFDIFMDSLNNLFSDIMNFIFGSSNH